MKTTMTRLEEVNELEACMLLIKERIDVLGTYQGER
jgi:hypothetical protein